MSLKKMGRPVSENPKDYRFSIRLDKATIDFLDEYCKKKTKKRAEAIRDGINKLKDEL